MEKNKLLLLNLQQFASKATLSGKGSEDIDYGESVPVEKYLNDDNEDEEETDEDDEEIDDDLDSDSEDTDQEDGDDETAEETDESESDEEEEADKSKTKPTEDKPKTENKTDKPQSRNINHEKAEERRRLEAQKKRDEELINTGIKEALGGVNPFTGEKIETDEDITEYKLMKKAKDKGLDPIADYHKMAKLHAKELKEETEKAEADKKSFEEKQRADIKEFTENYPDVVIGDLIKNEDFKDFSDGLIGKVPLSKIYEKYIKVNQDKNKKEQDAFDMKEARKKSSPGTLNSGSNANDGLYTKEELGRLSQEEIKNNWAKVEKSYNKLSSK